MKVYHKNPRQITDRQMDQLRANLAELGDLSGIVHDLNSDEIVGGNQRSRAISVDLCEIELTHQADEPDEQGTVAHGFIVWKGKRYAYRQVRWTSDQCEKANITANKLGGSWDFDVLANEFEVGDLLEWGFEESELVGFDVSEPATGDTEPQIDRAEELRVKWGVESGQLWRLGTHRLICGDCTDAATVARVMDGERAQITFTSPPYNLGGNISISNRSQSLKDTGTAYAGGNDSMSPVEYLDFLCSVTDVSLSCADYLFLNVQSLAGNKIALIEYLYRYRAHFVDVAVWHKTNQQPAMAEKVMNSCFEYVFVLSAESGPSRAVKTASFRGTFDNVYTSTINVNEFSDVHGAAFPVGFVSHFLGAFCPSVCFEPFSGTGTTIIACENLGRQCRAIEISPAYVAVALQRYADHTGQTPEWMK